MSFDLTQWHAGRVVGSAKPRWSPRCAVCGETLGRDVTLDVMGESGGGRFRLTCERRDPEHAAGVSRHYELSADHAPGRTIEHVALKAWADPAHLAAAVIEWLFAFQLIREASDEKRGSKV